LLRAELHVHPIDDAERFNGSGLAIVNPPWPLEDELRDLLPWLAEVMAQSQGGWRLDWLVAE
ncbi:23S rRNA (adenine(2030)-N(6))-methyltransferase RlmJ, partial [Pseudomonas aeruginosa]